MSIEHKIDPLAIIAGLDIEQMEAMRGELEKQTAALDMLISAAVVHRDGKPPKRDYQRKKPPAKMPPPDSPPVRQSTNDSSGGKSLKLRTIEFLRAHTSARINVMADELGCDVGELRVLLTTDAAFASRGVGFYTLA